MYTAKCMSPVSAKVRDIHEMPNPKNKEELSAAKDK
jgi:hypothetical protein